MYAQLARTERILFNASFDRCLETCEADIHFINFFYSNLRSSSSEIAKILDMHPLNRRIYALRHSIYMLIEFSEQRRNADDLIKITCMHLQPGIKPFMLDSWLNSLLLAVAEYDREYTPRTQTIWRKVMSPGIEFVKNHLEVIDSPEKRFKEGTF